MNDHQQETVNDKKKSASEILADEIKSISGQDSLSSREVNRLKRKAKMDARAGKKAEESFYDQLLIDLFSRRWERRHSAVTGLRELVKRHGESGGHLGGCNKEENDQRHNLCLEDLLVRLLSVLAS